MVAHRGERDPGGPTRDGRRLARRAARRLASGLSRVVEVEAGINFVDTADTYSGGSSERMLGQALKNFGVKRDEIIVATKVFGETGRLVAPA